MVVLWQSDSFEDMVGSMAGCGRGNLSVVTDFDRTLTTGKAIECHILVASSAEVEKEWREDAAELVEASRTPAEQTPEHLSGVGWWRRYNELLQKHGVQDHHIKRAVEKHPLPLFRPGVADFHEMCVAHKVSTVVISAGIHNVVEYVYEKELAHIPKPHIIANKIDACSVSHPADPITSRGKGVALQHATSEVTEALHARPITIVIGDKPNDSTAADLHPRRNCPDSPARLIKVGIINDMSRWDQFIESFDVVLDGHSEHCPFTYLKENVLSPLLSESLQETNSSAS
eukprot:TRINITY_DN2921_c1_g1_i1.p1 TRINITY_DN2921_c1_g1~~TRINITY_DN2921_c1_g1_i1.p1  ORF type:complete len:287 (+),score=91.10 TRINITY_DN2921_c1_g1_i1:86-946(+)